MDAPLFCPDRFGSPVPAITRREGRRFSAALALSAGLAIGALLTAGAVLTHPAPALRCATASER